MFAKIIAASLLIGFFVSTSYAQPLAWKLAKDDVIEFEQIATQKHTVKINGSVSTQESKTTTQIRVQVREVRANGFVVEVSKPRIAFQHLVDGQVQKLPQYDEQMMKGIHHTVTLSPQGRIVEMQGYEDFLKTLAGRMKEHIPSATDALLVKMLRATHPEGELKNSFGDLFGPLPENDKAWQRTYVERILMFGSLRATAEYTHDEADTIRYTIETKYELPKEGDLLWRITKGTVDSDKASGVIRFDASRGRLIEHRRSMVLKGSLMIEGIADPVEFSSDNEITIRMK